MAELGETGDPKQLVPGQPEAIEENARVLQGRANSAAQAGQGPLAVDTGAWKGKAANEFHDKTTKQNQSSTSHRRRHSVTLVSNIDRPPARSFRTLASNYAAREMKQRGS